MLVKDYDPRVQAALEQVSEGGWREFSAFAGPRLQRLTGWDNVVLIGDASHPLSGPSKPFHLLSTTKAKTYGSVIGAFGSGAAFALEDGWILAQAIKHTRSFPRPIEEALAIFDQIRSPYYRRMCVFSVQV